MIHSCVTEKKKKRRTEAHIKLEKNSEYSHMPMFTYFLGRR